jgi:hypothetical protein
MHLGEFYRDLGDEISTSINPVSYPAKLVHLRITKLALAMLID